MRAIRRKYIFINIVISVAEFLVDTYATIYMLNKGASYIQIGIIWMIYLAATAFTDYPTGGFADRYGRRKMYALGVVLTSVSYFLMLSDYIYILYVSYAIKGIGTSFISGSLMAWLSAAIDNNDEFNEVISKNNLSCNVVSFILPFCILIMKNIDLDVVFAVCGILELGVGIYTIVGLKENYGAQEKIKNIYKESTYYFFHNKILILLTLVNVSLYLFYTIFYYIWQPTAILVIGELKYLPLFYGVFNLFMGISAYAFNLLKRTRKYVAILCVMSIYFCSFLTFYLAARYGLFIFLVVGMTFFGIGGGVVFMLINGAINENTKDEYKASTYSLVSSICTLFNIAFQYIFGKIADVYGYNRLNSIGMIVAGIFTVLIIFI